MKPIAAGVAAGLVLAWLVGYNNVYARQRGQARVIRQQIVQEQADQRVQKDTTALLQQLERYHAQLPSEPDPSWLVREVMAANREAGLDLASIQQENPHANKSFTRLAVTLQFHATYHQLGAFLDRLEHSERFIRVEQLSVSNGRSGDEPPLVQLTLSTIFVPGALDSLAPAPGTTRPASADVEAG